jgi:hypothetical protein
MQIYIKRNGLVIRTCDREDYLAWISQGGACAGDEWQDVGDSTWQNIEENPPFEKNKPSSRSWSRRDQQINEAMNQVYKFRTSGMHQKIQTKKAKINLK